MVLPDASSVLMRVAVRPRTVRTEVVVSMLGYEGAMIQESEGDGEVTYSRYFRDPLPPHPTFSGSNHPSSGSQEQSDRERRCRESR